MKFKINRTARRNPWALARLHAEIAEARKAILRIGAGDTLLAPGTDAVLAEAQRLSGWAHSLEDDFLLATGRRDSPFTDVENPGRWLDWLREVGIPDPSEPVPSPAPETVTSPAVTP